MYGSIKNNAKFMEFTVEDAEPTLEEAQKFIGGYVELLELTCGGCLLIDEDAKLKKPVPSRNEKASLLDFHLDLKGIACSKGSACQSGSSSGSHVLNSIQSKELRQRPSLRFSFSIFNTIREVDYVISSLKEFIN